MKLNTKYCGEISYEPHELITFPDGLFGFETYHSYLLIRLEDDHGSPFCLQSVEEPDLAFILVDPFQLMPEYAPDLSDEDCERRRRPCTLCDLCAAKARIGKYSQSALSDCREYPHTHRFPSYLTQR